MQSALVLVNSSYQLTCAIEYLLSQGSIDNVSIVTSESTSSATYLQMERLAKDFGIHAIDCIQLVNSGPLEHRIGCYGEFFKQNLANKKFDYLVVGDIRHSWIHDFTCSVDAQEKIMVDDGGAVLSIIKYILAPLNFTLPIPNLKGTLERQALAESIKRQFGMLILPTKIQLFSIFQKQVPESATRNKFSFVKRYYNPEQTYQFANEVHIIGAPFVEHDFLSQQEYLEYLSQLTKIASLFDGARCIYYSHRFERDNKGKNDALESIGFEIRDSDINYELSLIQSATIPKAVGSVISTSLFNIKAIFEQQVQSYFVPLKKQHINRFKQTFWMADKYTLAEHWQGIIEHFPRYEVVSVNKEGKCLI